MVLTMRRDGEKGWGKGGHEEDGVASMSTGCRHNMVTVHDISFTVVANRFH